jgi:hypothetical protein
MTGKCLTLLSVLISPLLSKTLITPSQAPRTARDFATLPGMGPTQHVSSEPRPVVGIKYLV